MMGFFKTNEGKLSMMRLLCLLIVLLVTPFIYLNPGESMPAFTLLGMAIAGKWLQGGGK